MPKYAFFGGNIVPIEQAKVSIMTHAFNYGTGCFEGIRAYWNEAEEQLYLFRMKEHYERMHRSARILHMGKSPWLWLTSWPLRDTANSSSSVGETNIYGNSLHSGCGRYL